MRSADRRSLPDRARFNPRLRQSLAALAIGLPLLTATAAGASETITYSYDARGRLKETSHSGTVNNGVITCYQYGADNRQQVDVKNSG